MWLCLSLYYNIYALTTPVEEVFVLVYYPLKQGNQSRLKTKCLEFAIIINKLYTVGNSNTRK